MYYLSSFLFSVISLTLVSCASIREKRQVTTSYVIDVYVVVDHDMYQKWKNWQIETTGETNATKLATETIATIKSYVSLLFHQANLRLQTVNRTSPYSLSMQIVRMDIDVNIPNLNGSNNIAQALDIFTKWMNGSSVPYDHAVLMTSLEFKGENSAGEKLTYLGRAYVSKMCSLNYSLSVVVDNGAFQSSYHMTHEIGHSLGAQHDGTSTSANCSQSDSYLMVPVGISSDTSTDHPWYFSSCSVNNIKTYLETSSINVNQGTDIVDCFSKKLQPIQEFLDEEKVKAGQRYPPDQQCQMIYGKTSRACPDAGQGNLENICTTMGCVNPDNQTLCNIHFAAEWTSCGNGKRCFMGKCISDPEAPDIGDCYLGDSLDRIDGLSCSRAILDAPRRCYDTNVKTKCCKSCQQISAVNPSWPVVLFGGSFPLPSTNRTSKAIRITNNT
ncbi:ADAM family mig-17 [Biomphalaria glabrata]|nr:ADAM family mig-17 [Biomphalaria glabrata]